MNRLLAYCGASIAALCAAGAAVSQQPATNAPPAKTAMPAAFTNEFTERAGGKTNLTEITSSQLRIDTDKKIANFDGNVVVVDPSFLLRSDRLVVFLSQNGSGMDRAEAYGDVVIVQDREKRRARSQKAVYTTGNGNIVLTGEPSLENANGITRGTVITINRTNNIVQVEGETRSIIDLSPASDAGAQTNKVSPPGAKP